MEDEKRERGVDGKVPGLGHVHLDEEFESGIEDGRGGKEHVRSGIDEGKGGKLRAREEWE